MMLWVDHHCELAGMLNQVPQGWLATQHWYDFARILPEAQHVIVVGREQLRQHVGQWYLHAARALGPILAAARSVKTAQSLLGLCLSYLKLM